MGLVDVAAATARRHAMLAEGDRVLVAVSGGADSVALLHVLRELAPRLRLSLHVLHVDHGLRPESAGEAIQVGAWMRARNIPHHILTWQKPVVTGSVQANAREARYALMLDWCRANNVSTLLVAHHRDDQVETLVDRILRGSGADFRPVDATA